MLVVWCVLVAMLAQGAAVVATSNSETSTPLASVSRENQSFNDNVKATNATSDLERTVSKDALTFPEWARAELEAPLTDASSCRQKCGKNIGFTCSCTLHCLVHKNCCEDIYAFCPEVLEESRLRYGHMLDMKVECLKENVFVITDCGNPRSASTSDLSLNGITENPTPATEQSLTTAQEINENHPIPQETTISQIGNREYELNINDIFNAINHPYVTDTTTGFVYKNMEIFSCAALDNSNPVTWEVDIAGETMNDLKSVEELLRKAKRLFFSQPESLLTFLDMTRCRFESIGTCQEKYWTSDITLLYKCQQFISYVDVLELVYNNRYCKLCNDFRADQIHAEVYGKKSNFLFSLTMTLSGQSILVTTLKNMFSVTWDIASCQLSHSSVALVDASASFCETRCIKGTVKRLSGVCESLASLLISVSDDGYPLTVDEYKKFPEFVRCFIKMYVKLNIENDLSPTILIFDLTRNVSLYATQVFIYKTQTFNLEEVMMPMLSLMSKTFKVFRKSQVGYLRNVWSNNSTLHYLAVKSKYFTQFYNLLINEPRKVIIDQEDITMICLFSAVYKPLAAPLRGSGLLCEAVPLLDGDHEAIS
jgi:hypothetical protein